MHAHKNIYDTVVIGGGQAGLAAGYFLQRSGRPFVILDAGSQTGDAWRNRWESLRLFSPAQYDGLPGLPFPAQAGTFPTKDQMAAYLTQYVRRFNLPVVHGRRVTRVTRRPSGMLVECDGERLLCGNVIVATGAYARPHVPEYAHLLSPEIQQMHSTAYRRPGALKEGTVLVAGFGTSGAEIAADLRKIGRRVLLSGRPTPQLLSKFVPAIFASRNPLLKLAGKAYWRFMHQVVTIDTPLGRKAKEQIPLRGQPLIRVNQADLQALGVVTVPRVAGVRDGHPQLEDGAVPEVSAVVWCTGFRPNHECLDIPELPRNAKGWPIAPHGVVEAIPGLFFVGLPFQVGLTSTLVGGVGRDAEFVVREIETRRLQSPPAPLDASAADVGQAIEQAV